MAKRYYIHLEIDPRLRKSLRYEAARQEKSMCNLVMEIFSDYLAKRKEAFPTLPLEPGENTPEAPKVDSSEAAQHQAA
jgi:hypothetical protein